jgi:2-dehydro-3-deoxygalactonokinase
MVFYQACLLTFMTTPHLIALDWGTSNLRASLLNHDGSIIETRSAPGGVMAVKDRQFSAALLSLCGDWITQFACPLIASGMVGSRQGWQEAPYLDCPATVAQAAQALTAVALEDTAEPASARYLHIAPGLRCAEANDQFDVMRGEEIQIWGAGIAPGSLCVLPGTHSKWAWVGRGGQITRFQTYMTGELFGLLTKHGILGRLMVFGETHKDDFLTGVRIGVASHTQATHVIFSARTAGLMSNISPQGLPDYLSGLLIGVELGSALFSSAADAKPEVTLIGDDELCWRYELAFELVGLRTRRAPDGATTRGQWMVAQAANLLIQPS